MFDVIAAVIVQRAKHDHNENLIQVGRQQLPLKPRGERGCDRSRGGVGQRQTPANPLTAVLPPGRDTMGPACPDRRVVQRRRALCKQAKVDEVLRREHQASLFACSSIKHLQLKACLWVSTEIREDQWLGSQCRPWMSS